MNPFPIVKYKGPQYFCDRVEETQVLTEALKSGRSVTLYAIRRLGKTGLIHHAFHQLQKSSKYVCIYLDIYDTANAKDFVNVFCNQVLQKLEKSNENYLKRVADFFGKYRPSISFDTITGNPSISLDIKTQQDFQMSMDVIMDYIKSQKKQLIIAIDEFQQIQFYENKHLAASLRKYLQTIPNLTMVFAGSQRHMLLDLFASPKQALYRTTQLMPLEKIEKSEYHQYISFHFKQGLKKISNKLIDDILDWTRVHTYYTQYFCHRLYGKNIKQIKAQDVQQLKHQLLKENEVLFQNYRQLMSRQQWKLLKAIAKEERVVAPTSKEFIHTHGLGAHSTVRLSLAYLEEKQMVYHEFDDETEKPIYFVYDVFLSRWIQSLKS